ncbi:MAG: hypothetical protein LQ346_000189 [Caloplaca aetnensis]|nr:MAG: hypothetical protein LQ346_000189 [Caloplaca aetnensis]
MSDGAEKQVLRDEIARLRAQLVALDPKLERRPHLEPVGSSPSHALLLLSDTALPLGSFAFSSGLESYLAHNPSPRPPPIQPFLTLALQTLTTTTLPFLLAAYRKPSQLQELDDTLDASVLCHVAKRASVAQGRALLTVWERAFRGAVDPGLESARTLEDVSMAMKKLPSSTAQGGVMSTADMPVVGHFAPLWAVVACALSIPIRDSAYVFLLNHAKAVLSAAVRASVVGPYQAQAVLGSPWLRAEVARCLEKNWNVPIEDAGQGVPALDLWMGRHEMLYSRIFNS